MECSIYPKEFFVGDLVTLYYPLSEAQESAITSFNIENICQNEELTIKSICIINKNGTKYLLLQFVPWNAGEISFPSLENIGASFKLPNIKVSSVLEKLDMNAITLQDVRSPILQAGTIYLLYKYIALFLIATLSIAFVLRFIKKQKTSFFNLVLSRYAIIRFYFQLLIFKKNLKSLSSKNEKEVKLIVNKYEAYLKNFLFSIYKFKDATRYHALTYTEIEKEVEMSNPSSEKLNCLHSLFEMIKKMKFANLDKNVEKDANSLVFTSFHLIKLFVKR